MKIGYACHKGTEGAKLIHQLASKDADYIVEKRAYSGSMRLVSIHWYEVSTRAMVSKQ